MEVVFAARTASVARFTPAVLGLSGEITVKEFVNIFLPHRPNFSTRRS